MIIDQFVYQAPIVKNNGQVWIINKNFNIMEKDIEIYLCDFIYF